MAKAILKLFQLSGSFIILLTERSNVNVLWAHWVANRRCIIIDNCRQWRCWQWVLTVWLGFVQCSYTAKPMFGFLKLWKVRGYCYAPGLNETMW